MSDDADAILYGLDLLARLARDHPRLAGGALLVGLVVSLPLTIWGFVSANVDRDSLRAQGYPRAARFFDIGADVGALAVAVLKAAKNRKKDPS